MSKETIDIEQVMSSFSSHLEQRYSSPGRFKDGIAEMLQSKREKNDGSGYREVMERNLVFLYYFLEELKSLMEIMLARVNDDERFMEIDPGLTIMDIEKQLKAETERKHGELFGEGAEYGLPGLVGDEGESGYIEKLEFHYSYLMAARSFSIDFINILYAAQREYRIENPSYEKVWNYIDMSVNYYIGNISVGEKQG